jgi:hypothetical protein
VIFKYIGHCFCREIKSVDFWATRGRSAMKMEALNNNQKTEGHVHENKDALLREIFVRSSSTGKLHLSGSIGSTSHPDMQQIRIIRFFLKKGHIGSLRWKTKINTNRCFRLHIYLRKHKTLIHNFLHVFDEWGKKTSHRKMQCN